MPYLTRFGSATETGSGDPITWSEMAETIGIELRWDPPVHPGEYLHTPQREELHGVLRAYNALPRCAQGVAIGNNQCDGCDEGSRQSDEWR
jgi:hypothetical protein